MRILDRLKELTEGVSNKEAWEVPFSEIENQDINSPYPKAPFRWKSPFTGEFRYLDSTSALNAVIQKDRDKHKKAVEKAFKQGKNVPSNVLDEYPDLRR